MKRFAMVALGLAVLAPAPAFAQGFAPADGSFWAKVGYGYSRADKDFSGIDDAAVADVAKGSRQPFRSRQGDIVEGTLQTHEITLDGVWAPADGWVLGGFVPILKAVRYKNPRPFQTKATRPGDVVLFGGRQLTPRDMRKFGATAYLKTKIPTSFKYPYTNEALTGEGQFDVSGAVGLTYALAPKLHLNTSIEARYRFPFNSPEGYVRPGNELDGTITLGGSPVGGLWLSGGLTGLWGTPFVVRPAGATEEEEKMRRRFSTVVVSAYWFGFGKLVGAPGLAIDLWGKVPLFGQDYPVMYSSGLGVAKSF